MERARKLISKEKIVLKGISFNNFNDSDSVNATLQRIEKHLEKIAMNANNTADVAPQMKRKPDEELKENSPKVQILSDDDYMDRLIREDDWNDHQFATGERDEKSRCQQDIAMQKCTRKDDRNKDQSKTSNAEQSPQGKQERPTLNCTGPYDRSSPSPDYTGQYDRSNQSTVSRREQSPSREMKRLERDLYALREGLRRLPQRRIGERSRDAGVCAFCKVRNDHFSDSCPKCIEGDQRFKIIMREGICQYCLRKCNKRADECRQANEQCWYCSIVRNSVLDFIIPDDDGHHRALCSVPDSKDRIRHAIWNVRTQLEILERQGSNQ
nr:unnamed protein product [Haemonchus contortus]